MQFLLSSKWNALRCHSSPAHLPFQQHIQDIQNKRSKLFPDRKRIPGRKTKFLIAIAFLIHIYGFVKVKEAKRIYASKSEQIRIMQRKSAPYFQSIDDMQYTTLKHRTDLILCQIFKHKGGQGYLSKMKRFHKPGFYQNDSLYTTLAGGGAERYVGSLTAYEQNRYFCGFNIQNI